MCLKIFGDESSSNFLKSLFGIIVFKVLEFCWYVLLTRLQRTSITSLISNCGLFSPLFTYLCFCQYFEVVSYFHI